MSLEWQVNVRQDLATTALDADACTPVSLFQTHSYCVQTTDFFFFFFLTYDSIG